MKNSTAGAAIDVAPAAATERYSSRDEPVIAVATTSS
jgi:hypothetical protein